MSKITLPPPGTIHNFITPSCVKVGEKVELEIDDDGFILFLPTGQFTPDLPMGPVTPGVTYHTAGPTEVDVVLGYFDAKKKLTYTLVIRIRKECLDTSGAFQ